MTKKISSAIFFFLAINSLMAQSSYIIRGTVIDENNAPLQFATIFLAASKTGTISNNNGEFSLNISEKEETLSVSFIGYETQAICINRNTEFLTIRMKPSSIPLNEFSVSGLSAENLLRKAIKNIPDNYSTAPFLLQAYYRAKVIEKDTMLYMEETVFDIVKSYQSSFSDNYFLVKNRNFRFAPDRTRWRGIGNFDIVKSISTIFNAKFFRNYDIRYLPSTTFDSKPVYVLGYFHRESSSRGKIYIDVEDLAFIRFELNPESGNNRTIQYKKIDRQYYLMSGNTFYVNRRSDRMMLAETNMVTTAVNHQFSQDDIDGTHVDVRDILEVYATQEQDTIFWQQHNSILPDSTILEALERYNAKRGLKDVIDGNPPYKAYIKRLYTPHITLFISSDFAHDFSAFNECSNSINRYISGALYRNIRNPLIKILSATIYNYFISPSLGDAVSEWLLLNKNGIPAKMNPTMFNRYESAFLHHIKNEVLSDFKNDNYIDFMRLHTIRNEGRYVKSFLMEEELAKIDLSNRNNKHNYVMLYLMEHLSLRIMSTRNPYKKDIKPSKKSEDKQPVIVDRNRSWVNYLFNPEMKYARHIQQAGLTDEEQNYLKQSAYWSWINLISPQMFLLPKFSLGQKNSFTFSLNYLPVPFGEMFGQNIWLMHNHKQLHGVFIKQYRNYEQTTFGIGYKLYDVKLFRNACMTTSIDFWQQPTDFNFMETSCFGGFHIGQTFEYQFLQNQFSRQNKLSFLFGYDYKTKGYMPESFFISQNFNVNVGLKWFF